MLTLRGGARRQALTVAEALAASPAARPSPSFRKARRGRSRAATRRHGHPQRRHPVDPDGADQRRPRADDDRRRQSRASAQAVRRTMRSDRSARRSARACCRWPTLVAAAPLGRDDRRWRRLVRLRQPGRLLAAGQRGRSGRRDPAVAVAGRAADLVAARLSAVAEPAGRDRPALRAGAAAADGAVPGRSPASAAPSSSCRSAAR